MVCRLPGVHLPPVRKVQIFALRLLGVGGDLKYARCQEYILKLSIK